jgi:drug/metabolite transporter (DMT)-like permease
MDNAQIIAGRVSGAIGLALLVTSLRRWDWLYTDPRVWWRPWQGAAGILLCCIASGITLWNRATPYTEPDSTDPDATTVLGLDPATTERSARAKKGHSN